MTSLIITIDEQKFEIDATVSPACQQHCLISVNGQEVDILIPETSMPGQDIEWIVVNGKPYELTFDDNLTWLRTFNGIHAVVVEDIEAGTARPRSGDGRIKAPIPGLVTRILVTKGDRVKADQPIIVLEAMKMENEIRAPFEGTVRAIAVSEGESVVRNAILAEIG